MCWMLFEICFSFSLSLFYCDQDPPPSDLFTKDPIRAKHTRCNNAVELVIDFSGFSFDWRMHILESIGMRKENGTEREHKSIKKYEKINTNQMICNEIETATTE